MKESDILRKLDGLTIDQHMAVASGDFDGYLVDIDPELVIELITEAIATAPIGDWQWLQTCLIARDDMSIGSAVRECCKGALSAWEKEFYELVGYVQDHEHERPPREQTDMIELLIGIIIAAFLASLLEE